MDVVPCEALCNDLQSCIENSPICSEFNVKNYTPLCLGRCEQHPGRFDYAEDPVDCVRAFELNLLTDERDAFLPFCSPETCLSSCGGLDPMCSARRHRHGAVRTGRCRDPYATDRRRVLSPVICDAKVSRRIRNRLETMNEVTPLGCAVCPIRMDYSNAGLQSAVMPYVNMAKAERDAA